MSDVQLLLGDCLERMKELPDNSVDSVVCDPPYGLKFMSQKWDYDVPSQAIWEECLRVLKPGGYLLAFAGTRTQHRMACRIEDAGFEIRDMIAWIYGSGMPKHKSCLKPAIEPITMARKPAKKATLLNIDDCRVEKLSGDRTEYGVDGDEGSPTDNVFGDRKRVAYVPNELGRYPSNIITDGSDEVVSLFPDSNGAGKSLPRVKITGYGDGIGTGKSEYLGGERIPFESGTGSAARFFYCAKASRKERGEGNTHPTIKPIALMEYLIKLVAPENGVVLDPFLGSGTTGIAALNTGRGFVGIERDEEYFNIAEGRIADAVTNNSLDNASVACYTIAQEPANKLL